MYFNSFEYIVFLWGVYVLYWTIKERRKLRFSIANREKPKVSLRNLAAAPRYARQSGDTPRPGNEQRETEGFSP